MSEKLTAADSRGTQEIKDLLGKDFVVTKFEPKLGQIAIRTTRGMRNQYSILIHLPTADNSRPQKLHDPSEPDVDWDDEDNLPFDPTKIGKMKVARFEIATVRKDGTINNANIVNPGYITNITEFDGLPLEEVLRLFTAEHLLDLGMLDPEANVSAFDDETFAHGRDGVRAKITGILGNKRGNDSLSGYLKWFERRTKKSQGTLSPEFEEAMAAVHRAVGLIAA